MTTRRFFCFNISSASLFFLLRLSVASEPLPVSDATSGAKAAEPFKTKEGFSMTLLAEEPLVTDPVAMCYCGWLRPLETGREERVMEAVTKVLP